MNTKFQAGQIVIVNKKSHVFAACVRRVWVGERTTQVLVTNLREQIDTFVCESQITPCKVKANINGKVRTVTLAMSHANGRDFWYISRGKYHFLAREDIVRIAAA